MRRMLLELMGKKNPRVDLRLLLVVDKEVMMATNLMVKPVMGKDKRVTRTLERTKGMTKTRRIRIVSKRGTRD